MYSKMLESLEKCGRLFCNVADSGGTYWKDFFTHPPLLKKPVALVVKRRVCRFVSFINFFRNLFIYFIFCFCLFGLCIMM